MIPSKLKNVIESARKAMINDEENWIYLGHRYLICRELGPNTNYSNFSLKAFGLRRRTYLQMLCIKKVMHLWQKEFPNNEMPAETISLLEKYFIGHASPDPKLSKSGKYYEFMTFLEGDNPVYLVANACISSLRIAEHDEFLFTDEGKEILKQLDYPVEDLLDGEIDVDLLDASYSACGAYENGLFNSPTLSLEFWTWYLDEAVPKAYESVD